MRTWAAVAALTMLGCATANAQTSDSIEGAAVERSSAPGPEWAAALERGRSFVAHNQSYQLLPGVSAISGDYAASVRKAMDLIGASSSSQLATRGSYVLYRRGQQPGNAELRQVDFVRIHPAAINTRSGAVGVLLGTIDVRLRNYADRKAVAAAHRLRIDASFPQLQKVFLRVPDGLDIIEATAEVAADPRVQSASAELLENMRAAD